VWSGTNETRVGIGCLAVPALPWPDAASCRDPAARRYSTHSGLPGLALSCPTHCPRRSWTLRPLKSASQSARRNAPWERCVWRRLLPILESDSFFLNLPLYALKSCSPCLEFMCAPALASPPHGEVDIIPNTVTGHPQLIFPTLTYVWQALKSED